MTPSLHHPIKPLALSLLTACLLWPSAARAAEVAHAAPAKAPAAAKNQAASTKTLVADAGASKVALAPATTEHTGDPLDPLERLRQRLAEKLSTHKPADGPASSELRVVAKLPKPAAAPKKPSAKAHSATKAHAAAGHMATASAHSKLAPLPGHAAHTAHTAHGAQAKHAHWSYQGEAGPQAWSQLKSEFSLCSSGQRQSPIDIRGGLAVELDPVRFDYQASRFAVVDNGHTVQVNLASGNSIEVAGKRFELVQFHFHRPSEERIDGKQFEMSLHLVHKDEQGRLAVVALLFDKGAAQPVLQRVWNNLPLEKNEELAARLPLELNALLPADRRYFTYMGSLTTPPCSEGVQWIVMREPVTASIEQIDLFARMYPMNARPLQASAGRRIMQSQ
jgi:carbonic anhydrase